MNIRVRTPEFVSYRASISICELVRIISFSKVAIRHAYIPKPDIDLYCDDLVRILQVWI